MSKKLRYEAVPSLHSICRANEQNHVSAWKMPLAFSYISHFSRFAIHIYAGKIYCTYSFAVQLRCILSHIFYQLTCIRICINTEEFRYNFCDLNDSTRESFRGECPRANLPVYFFHRSSLHRILIGAGRARIGEEKDATCVYRSETSFARGTAPDGISGRLSARHIFDERKIRRI